jgi:hypothetical protein
MSEILVIGAVTVVGFVLGYRLSLYKCEEAEIAIEAPIVVKIDVDDGAVGYPYWEIE